MAVLKETPVGSGKYEIVVDPGVYLVFVKKVGYYVSEDRVVTKPGFFKFVARLNRCLEPDGGYDPIKESIDRKNSIKPPTDLFTKKPKFLNPPL